MDPVAKVAEGISAELSDLKEQRRSAQAEAERAADRPEELSDGRQR
jgi:hypothetical protein